MKKIYTILSAALLLVAAASCNKENTCADNTPAEGTTFTVTLDEGAKFAIDGQGKSTWTPGDIISIYNGNYGVQGDVLFRDNQGAWPDPTCAQDIQITQDMISADGKQVIFNVTLPAPNEGKWYLCAYGCPYMVAAFHHHGPVYTLFPEQIEGGLIPFVAATSTTGTKATFHNVSALVRMKCSDPSVKYVTFENNDGEKFINQGNIILNDNGTLLTIYDPQRKAPKFISHVEGLGADDYFYVGMYAEWLQQGFTIRTYEGWPDASTPKETVSISRPTALPEGHVLDLGDFLKASKKGKDDWTITGSGNVEALIDNDINTYWNAGTTLPASAVIDFHKDKELNKVILSQVFGNASVAPAKNVKVEVSADGSAWTEVYTVNEMGAEGYRKHYPFFGTWQIFTFRYARITILDAWDERSTGLAELDFALQGTDHDYETSATGYEYPTLFNGGSENYNPETGEGWGYFYSDGSDRFHAVGDHRMQRVINWLHNDAMNISCDVAAGNRLCYWSCDAWGCPKVTNGKVYQRFKLLPGTYTFQIASSHTSTNHVEIYGVVAKGQTLPDIADLPTKSLRFVRLDNAGVGTQIDLQFEVDTISDVCVGVVGNTYTNETDGQPYSEFYFNYFRFVVNNIK